MRRALFLVCALAVGCQKAGAPPKVDLPLLAHVPADTPYLYAMLEPVPRSTWERFAPIVGDIEKLLKKSPPEDPVAKAILQELGGNLSWAGLRKLTGLDPGARMVFYGVGLYPVARVELADDKALPATVERITKNAGVANPVVEHQGRKYWRYEEHDLVIAVAALDGQLVVAGGPKEIFDRDILPNVLGLAKPAKSALGEGTLAALIKKHELGPYAGYLDTALLLENSKQWIDKPACVSALAAWTKRIPRALLTTDRFKDGPLTGRMIVELEPALARRLSELVVEMPGFGPSKDAPFMVLGMAANLEKARLVLVDAAGAGAALGEACDPEMAAEMKEAQSTLSQPLPPGVDGIQGVLVSVLSAKIGPDGPGDVHGFALIAAKDPGGLLDKLAAILPIPMDKLARDGKFHELVPAGTIPVIGAVQAAVKSNAILVATGEKGPAAAEKALATTGPAPLFYLAYDYGRLMDVMMPRGAMTDNDLFGMMKRVTELFGVVSMTVRPTQAGLVIESSMGMRAP